MSTELVLEGTIESVTPGGTDRRRRWQVTLRVERVLAGDFGAERFAFVVHSPAKSGLAVGQHRIVRASRAGEGYTVDELQWLGGGESSPQP